MGGISFGISTVNMLHSDEIVEVESSEKAVYPSHFWAGMDSQTKSM